MTGYARNVIRRRFADEAAAPVWYGALRSPSARPFLSMMQIPRPMLASRYELVAALLPSRHVAGWVGFDAATGARVRISVVNAASAGAYTKLVGARQLHLCGVHEILLQGSFDSAELGIGLDKALIVLDYVAGTTLHRHTQGGRPIAPFKAVAWALRLINALEVLHQRGVPHGSVNARSVVVEPIGRVIPPVLLLASAPSLAAYCSPERIRGGGASKGDDVWGLLCTMYRMVTGVLPFGDAEPRALLADVSRGHPKALHDHGLQDPELQRVFDVGFEPNPRHRLCTLDELRRALDRWEREERPVVIPRAPTSRSVPRLGSLTMGSVAPPNAELVYDDARRALDDGEAPPLEGSAAAHRSAPLRDAVAPPSSPSSAEALLSVELSEAGAAAARQRARLDSLATQLSARRMRGGRRVWWLLGIPVVVAIGGMLFAEISKDKGSGATEESPAVAEEEVKGTRGAPAASAHRRQETPLSPAERLSRCVTSYFPSDVFAEGSDFGFLCTDDELRENALRLFRMAREQVEKRARAEQAAATAPGRGVPTTDGGILIVKSSVNTKLQELELGWYELLATAITRQGCCPNPGPVDLPETRGWCPQLKKALRQVAEDSRKVGDLAPAVQAFDQAVACLYANQTPRPYAYELHPSPEQRSMLQRFLTRAAELEAKRSSRR